MIRALFSVKDFSGSSNPYIELLVGSFPASVEPVAFTWRRALLGRYDVFHVHWPEYLFRAPRGPRRWLKSALAFGLIARLLASGTPVVVTMHNLRPHESGSAVETLLARWLDRLTDVRIYLNESDENDLDRGVVVLHGAYPESASVPGPREAGRRILFFGQIRPYKGLEELIAAFSALTDGELVIAGAAAVPEYADEVRRAVGADGRVHLRLGHIDDAELDELLAGADLVTLPYKYLYNSGAALLALGARKTILVPATGSTRALAAEVGSGWVELFDGPVSPAALEAGLKRARRHGERERPDLSKRERSLVGALHGAVYEALVAAGRGRGRGGKGRRAATLARLRADPRFLRHSELNR
ncbi:MULTISPECIES: glycosyltransferase [unclassified Rathayibacter]|uniref:glycosyltransferase n=1 Tax=unclassified Rathayibacter TaxID=2609250 RepID=UPI000CE7FAA5|nr:MULTISPECIES: glycosyltransferase [unclassified Rathayibacter]PPG39082.1 GDP-mannose--glycolipid 4-beta-D-mannosyltransferase [Rathayibacter sp. AY2B5]PPH29578.1 GDP-mannose--glycolipid 4-beta-D-mannosyltransferase [Rathayibacter sp. AY1F9]